MGAIASEYAAQPVMVHTTDKALEGDAAGNGRRKREPETETETETGLGLNGTVG
jgi:hypothetical protein